jgi:translation initiation factor 5A
MASKSVPTQAGLLKIGDHILIKDRPCQIKDIVKAKTGKHGCAKAHFTGIDIFTDQKCEYMETTTKNVEVPVITKNDYQVLNITKNAVSCLDEKCNVMDDLDMPNLCDSDLELAEKLLNAFDKEKDTKTIYVSVVSSMDISAIKGYKIK